MTLVLGDELFDHNLDFDLEFDLFDDEISETKEIGRKEEFEIDEQTVKRRKFPSPMQSIILTEINPNVRRLPENFCKAFNTLERKTLSKFFDQYVQPNCAIYMGDLKNPINNIQLLDMFDSMFQLMPDVIQLLKSVKIVKSFNSTII